jgi:hypothetical protein
MSAGALAGVRVVDMTRYIPGPYATMTLADLVADVVKIEPREGDPMRAFPPAVGESAARCPQSRKRSVAVDLRTARAAVAQAGRRGGSVRASSTSAVSARPSSSRRIRVSSIARSPATDRTARTPHARGTTSGTEPSADSSGPIATGTVVPSCPGRRSST